MYYVYLYLFIIISCVMLIYFSSYYYLKYWLGQLEFEYYPKHLTPETRFKYRPQKIYEFYERYQVKLDMETTRIQDNKIIATEKISPKTFINTNFNINPSNHYSVIKEYNNDNIPQFLGYFMKELNLPLSEYPKVILNMVSNKWSSSRFKFQTESRYIFQMYGEQEIYLINFLTIINDSNDKNKIEKINLGEGDLVYIPNGFVAFYKNLPNSRQHYNKVFFEFISPRNKILDFFISCLYKKTLLKYI